MNSLHYLHSHGVSNSPRAIAHSLVVLLVVISGSSLKTIESCNVVPFGSRRQIGPFYSFRINEFCDWHWFPPQTLRKSPAHPARAPFGVLAIVSFNKTKCLTVISFACFEKQCMC